MSQALGTIQQLIRFPVKTLGGEHLQNVRLTPIGLYGDRSMYYRFDDAEQRYVTIKNWPMLGTYRTTLHEAAPGELPSVTIESPSGATYTSWDDEDLLAEIATGTGRAITAHQLRPEDQSAQEVDQILISTDASLRSLSKLWGHGDLDVRRFRSNIVLQLAEDTPFVEKTWIGKHLKLGDTVLKLTEHCLRCSYVNADPVDGTVDPSVLKTVYRDAEQIFGIYAAVVTPGEIKLGDEATLLP